MFGGFLRVAAVVSAAGLASACTPTPAPQGQPAGAYQFLVIAGSASFSEDAFRINVATGKTDMNPGASALETVTDATPVPAGSYHLYSWTTFDSGATTREWNVYRFEAQSGRMWKITYDGKTTPSWTEVTPPPQ